MSTEALPQARAVARPRARFRLSPVVATIAGLDLLVVVVFAVISPDHVFLELDTVSNVAAGAAQVVLLGVAISLLLGAGEFDVSLGANLVLSSVVGAKVMTAIAGPAADQTVALSIGAGAAAAIAAGTAFGLVNGLVVTRLGVTSLIATLGTLGIGTGAAYVVTGGVDVPGIPSELQTSFGIREVAGFLPLPALVALAVCIGAALLVAYTRFGLHTLALGSSREAARRAGLPIERHLLILFVLAGGLAGLAGVIDLARFTTTSIGGHQTDALAAIAGAVIGGTALWGGRVSITGTVLGCLLPVILGVGLVIQGLQPFYQFIVVGVVLIAAVALRSSPSGAPSPLAARVNASKAP